MKHLIFLLLPFNIMAQSEQSEQFQIQTLDSVPFIECVQYESMIRFSDENNDIEFHEDGVSYFSDKGQGVVDVGYIEYDCEFFDIFQKLFKNISASQNNQLKELQLKILFYEKYFGKLEGDMESDCVQFIWAKNVPLEFCKD